MPDDVVLASCVVKPAHTVVIPVIAATMGKAFKSNTEGPDVKQPVEDIAKVRVPEYVPAGAPAVILTVVIVAALDT